MADAAVNDRLKFHAWLNAKRRCKNCNRTFQEIDNLGGLACAIHPLAMAPLGSRGEYACCKRREGSEGCCRADHVEQMYTTSVALRASTSHRTKNTLVIDANRFIMLAETLEECAAFVRDATWTPRSADGGGYAVDRIDFQQYNRLRRALGRNPDAPSLVTCARHLPLPRFR